MLSVIWILLAAAISLFCVHRSLAEEAGYEENEGIRWIVASIAVPVMALIITFNTVALPLYQRILEILPETDQGLKVISAFVIALVFGLLYVIGMPLSFAFFRTNGEERPVSEADAKRLAHSLISRIKSSARKY